MHGGFCLGWCRCCSYETSCRFNPFWFLTTLHPSLSLGQERLRPLFGIHSPPEEGDCSEPQRYDSCHSCPRSHPTLEAGTLPSSPAFTSEIKRGQGLVGKPDAEWSLLQDINSFKGVYANVEVWEKLPYRNPAMQIDTTPVSRLHKEERCRRCFRALQGGQAHFSSPVPKSGKIPEGKLAAQGSSAIPRAVTQARLCPAQRRLPDPPQRPKGARSRQEPK